MAGIAPIGAVILAAGLSRRMGRPKLTLEVAGRPVLAWTIDHVLSAGLMTVVVIGPDRPDLEAIIPIHPRLGLVVNPDPAAGQAGSLRVGLGALPDEVGGAALFLGDMPCVFAEVITAVLGAAAATARTIVRPRFGPPPGRPGHPVILARTWFAECSSLTGDEGARSLLAAHPEEIESVPIASAAPLLDLDSLTDVAAVEAALLTHYRPCTVI